VTVKHIFKKGVQYLTKLGMLFFDSLITGGFGECDCCGKKNPPVLYIFRALRSPNSRQRKMYRLCEDCAVGEGATK